MTEYTDEQIEAIVAEAIAAEASVARTETAPPSSAIVWWRAQMRARREAAQLADKPIAIVHALAIACGAGLTLAVVGVVIAALRGSFGRLSDIYASAALAASELNGTWITVPLTAMLVCVVIFSIAAVFVLRDE